MGFFDKLIETANSLASKTPGGKGILEGVVDVLKEQGVGGIVQDFKQKGLGEVIGSWVGKGKNMPIDVEQIKNALGSEKLKAIAMKAGISEENASRFLGEVLPGLIDQLTPEGKLPDDDPFGGQQGERGGGTAGGSADSGGDEFARGMGDGDRAP